ncbi:MAG: hypothetical protein LLG20_00295 [Acidobacteriales bacterium]|nr:hypothetical protein [Terriglobales bacterium]
MRTFLCLLFCSLALSAAPPRSPLRLLRVSFWTDARAADAPPFTVKDLTAKLGPNQARLVSLRGPQNGLVILLVLDLASDPTAAEAAKQALGESLKRLPANCYVALLKAQDGLRSLVDPTPDRDRIESEIKSIPVSGKAGLLDTLETAGRIGDTLMDKSGVRVAVFYVTDSSIYNYQEDYTNPVINSSDYRDMSRVFPEGLVKDKISKLATIMSALSPPLFVVHLSYQSDRLNEAYQSGLMSLAAESGGASAFCRSLAEIPESIDKIMRTIAASYTAEIELPHNPPKSVQLVLEGEARLNYRTRFSLKEK